jgi:hypothetical protein
LSWKANAVLNVTVPGVESGKWVIDGKEITGATTNVLTIKARSYRAGDHRLSFRAGDYSKTVIFTVVEYGGENGDGENKF